MVLIARAEMTELKMLSRLQTLSSIFTFIFNTQALSMVSVARELAEREGLLGFYKGFHYCAMQARIAISESHPSQISVVNYNATSDRDES
jgi:hypothetical protein